MSKGRVLVCDIQGVGCYFTDPQIHSVDGDAFGSGNCGQAGIVAFFESHKCNSLCRRLGQFLPAACTTIASESQLMDALSVGRAVALQGEFGIRE